MVATVVVATVVVATVVVAAVVTAVVAVVTPARACKRANLASIRAMRAFRTASINLIIGPCGSATGSGFG